MLEKSVLPLLTVALASLSGCVPRVPEGPGSFAAHSPIAIGPGGSPAVVGTYDFDMIGESQGAACAEWGPRGPDGFRMIYVNGRAASYAASVAGATFESNDLRIQQAQAAAVFTAISKLTGADLMFVTRSVVQSETAERICATVWGQVVRLKKGPTIMPPPGAPGGLATAPAPPPPPADATAPAK